MKYSVQLEFTNTISDSFLFTLIVLTILALVLFICILIFVVFVTIFERKILGAIQKRKGPNVTGFLGILQAVADGIKLFSKETVIPSRSDAFLFILSPVVVFVFSFVMWALLPLFPMTFLSNVHLGLIVFFTISIIGVHGLLYAGWSSNSRLPFYGALRSVAQMLAYDLCIGINLIIIVMYTQSFRILKVLVFQQESVWLLCLVLPSAGIFFICLLAELKRIPFDLPEAESELVSGYNTEYSGFLFAFFFLAEYSSLILFSNLFAILYMGGWTRSYFLVSVLGPFYPWSIDFFWYNCKVLFVLFVFISLRGTIARYRYDALMEIGWKILLPLSLAFLLLFLCLSLGVDISSGGSAESYFKTLWDALSNRR